MTKQTRRGSRNRATKITNQLPTFVEFVLDETGSMGSCAMATVAGFNDFLSEQRKITGDCYLSLTKFDTSGLKTPYQDVDLRLIPDMLSSMFCPGGGTNLYDAIGHRIKALSGRMSSWAVKPNVLFVVMTDGEENGSRQYNLQSIRSLIEQYNGAGWTFVYLGANQNAVKVGESMGFRSGNCKSFATEKMRETMQDLSAATTVYRAAASTATTRNFF